MGSRAAENQGIKSYRFIRSGARAAGAGLKIKGLRPLDNPWAAFSTG